MAWRRAAPRIVKEDRMFRVLSIDGGGIKGIFPAAFLCALQESLERPIAEYFDLIAGTSTGGIIASERVKDFETGGVRV